MAKKKQPVKVETKKVKSPAKSFKGYKIWYHVKDQLKEVLRIGVPLIVGWVTTKDPAMTAMATALGRFLITLFEYYYKKY